MFKPFAKIVSLVCTGMVGSAVLAGSISIPNASFESPVVPPVSPYAQPDMDSWEKTPQPYWYDPTADGPWSQLVGEFYNVPYPGVYIDNVDGNQAAFLFALPGAGIFQDYDCIGGTNTVPAHDFTNVFAPYKTYTMTAGLIGEGGGMPEGVPISLVLYYRDLNSNMVTIASTTVLNSTNTFTDRTNFVDFSVQTPAVNPTDAWAGKHIGVEVLSTADFSNYGGYWDVENIRLVEATPAQLVQPARGTNGQFSFTLVSETNLSFQLLTSPEITNSLTNWTVLATVTNTTGTLPFTDTVNTNSSRRFYSARQL